MKAIAITLLFALLAVSLASAIPKPEDKHGNDRVVDKKLSQQSHFDNEEEHNPDYDHEAFLGEKQAHEFDDLSPEESKEKLGIIYDKIDKDKDGFVTEDELKEWIRHVQNKYVVEDSQRQWKDHDTQNGKLSWEEYKKKTYGFMDTGEDTAEGDDFNYKTMLERDEERWRMADVDKDNMLDFEQFSAFLHPEDVSHMQDVVVKETLDDIDKDKDGYISMEEYIGDLWPQNDGEDEPEWVRSEREQFTTFRDKNKDGRMDQEEVKDWILPTDYDHSEAEAKHLVFESDGDKDKKLSKQEVLDNYDLFVGSQATDFGEALTRHDEF